MQFKNFLLISVFFGSTLYHIPGNANEAHIALHRKIVEMRHKIEGLNNRMAKLEAQAQVAIKEVNKLKEKNRLAKEYRDALEADMEVEVMGFENRDSICNNNNQLNPKQENSICKKKHIILSEKFTR